MVQFFKDIFTLPVMSLNVWQLLVLAAIVAVGLFLLFQVWKGFKALFKKIFRIGDKKDSSKQHKNSKDTVICHNCGMPLASCKCSACANMTLNQRFKKWRREERRNRKVAAAAKKAHRLQEKYNAK